MWIVRTEGEGKERWSEQRWLYSFDRPARVGAPKAAQGLVLWQPNTKWMGSHPPHPVTVYEPVDLPLIRLEDSMAEVPWALFFLPGRLGAVLNTLAASGDEPMADQPDESEATLTEDEWGNWTLGDEVDETETTDLWFDEGDQLDIDKHLLLTWTEDEERYPSWPSHLRALGGVRARQEALARVIASEETLREALGRYVNLGRALAKEHEVPPWVLTTLRASPDLATQRALAQNPSLDEDDYRWAAGAHLASWLKNPALPFYALSHPNPDFLLTEQARKAYASIGASR